MNNVLHQSRAHRTLHLIFTRNMTALADARQVVSPNLLQIQFSDVWDFAALIN